MRALIADDDRVNATILSTTLHRWQIDSLVVHDGGAAWDALAGAGRGAEAPPLAIIDWMMPTIDGVELCRRIRQDVRLAGMYVILLTGRDGRSDIVTGLDAGADDYMTKPFDPDELRARVQVGVRVLALQDRLAERVAELEVALSSVKRLQGLLPICSYCKRIRGDDQYWQQVDAYIAEHSDAEFTHGICPPCAEQVLAEIEKERLRGARG